MYVFACIMGHGPVVADMMDMLVDVMQRLGKMGGQVPTAVSARYLINYVLSVCIYLSIVACIFQ